MDFLIIIIPILLIVGLFPIIKLFMMISSLLDIQREILEIQKENNLILKAINYRQAQDRH